MSDALTALRTDADIWQAAARGAEAAYRATVLGALADVENALLARGAAEDRVRSLTRAVEAAEAAAELARSQYQSGLTDYQTLQSAEQSLLSARDGLVLAQADQANALIQLYLALGGGWEPAALPSGT